MQALSKGGKLTEFYVNKKKTGDNFLINLYSVIKQPFIPVVSELILMDFYMLSCVVKVAMYLFLLFPEMLTS